MLSMYVWGGGWWLVSKSPYLPLIVSALPDQVLPVTTETPQSRQWQPVKTKTTPDCNERDGRSQWDRAQCVVDVISPLVTVPTLVHDGHEIHLSGSPPMGAQCWPGDGCRPIGGPDPPGLPPVCLSGSWLSSHLTVSRCQHHHNNILLKYFNILIFHPGRDITRPRWSSLQLSWLWAWWLLKTWRSPPTRFDQRKYLRK